MGNGLTVYASDRLSTKNVQADAAATAAAAPVLLLFVKDAFQKPRLKTPRLLPGSDRMRHSLLRYHAVP